MNYVEVGKENSGNIEICYEDWGSGQPVVLIDGWPLSGRSWEKQVPALLDAGYRVITYDRRGFGDSSRPNSGYYYDVMAEDLHKLMVKLNVHDAALVGFSMGGGEVARYIGKYGSERISKVVYMSAITPFLLKSNGNSDGVDGSVFDGIKKAIAVDRLAFLTGFFANFYNVDVLMNKRISEEVVRLSWNIASMASPKATLDCVSAWLTDFREDLNRNTIPTLVVHGDADRIVPLAASGQRMTDAVKGSSLYVVKEGPHGLNWTHAEEVNRELLAFLGKK